MKIAYFNTAWTESGDKFLQSAEKKGVEVVPIHYSQIEFEAKAGSWEMYYNENPLSQFDIFYFRNVGDKNEALPLLLEYGKEKNIPIVDDYLSRLGGAMRKKKSSEAAFLLKDGVDYAKTFYAGSTVRLREVIKRWQKPVVVKATDGRHGTSTFLIKKDVDLDRALLGREGSQFLIQEYLPNDGDYRLFLVGYKLIAGFKRQKKEDKLILNRSLGPSVLLEKIPEDVKVLAEKATRIIGVEVAGIDAVIDERTKKPAIIEVNQSPEFYTMEKRTGIDIAGEIIDYLIKKAS
jgi:ribosomal protein S6--L-glutamate ligase